MQGKRKHDPRFRGLKPCRCACPSRPFFCLALEYPLPRYSIAYFVILAVSGCCISLLFCRFYDSGAWACDGASRRHANGACRPVVYEGRRQRPRVHVQAKDQQQQSHDFFEILVPFLPQGEEGKKSSSLALLCKRFEQDVM